MDSKSTRNESENLNTLTVRGTTATEYMGSFAALQSSVALEISASGAGPGAELRLTARQRDRLIFNTIRFGLGGGDAERRTANERDEAATRTIATNTQKLELFDISKR